MKKNLTRFPILFLLLALLTGAGFYSGVQIAGLVGKLDLRDSWMPLDAAPEEVAEPLVPSMGAIYVRGRSGRIYALAVDLGYFDGHWTEGSYPHYIDQWECSELADLPAPPEDTLTFVMNCGGQHEIIVTGVALSIAGELSGYYAATPPAFDQLFRGLFIIAISTVIGFALGIVASINAVNVLNMREASETAT